MNETLSVLSSHTSIRKFTGDPVTETELQAVLAAAQRGATAGNMQPYSILVIRSKETLARLAQTCDDQPFIAQASVGLLFVADSAKWHRYLTLRGIPGDFPGYRGPGLADLVLALQDTMIAAQNAVTAAESLGLGTCYIGDIVEHYETHKAMFRLPRHTLPLTLVVLGRCDSKPALRDRFDSRFVVFDEVYPDLDDGFADAMFSPREKGDRQWARKFYQRKMDAPFFPEMVRSLGLYLAEWDPPQSSLAGKGPSD